MLTGDDPGSVPPHRRISVGYADALLAGGLATTMLTTVYGKEGAGKSTLALELACAAARSVPMLYAVAHPESSTPTTFCVWRAASALRWPGCVLALSTRSTTLLTPATGPGLPQRHRRLPRLARVRRLQEWCLAADAAALGIAMYDTAGRRAGGYSVAYLGGAIKRVGSDYCELPGPPHDNGLRLGCGSTHGCVRRTRKLADTISRSWSGLLATDAIAAPLVS